MNTQNITHRIRQILWLILFSCLSITLSAQEPGNKTSDLLSIAKPGTAKGWIDIRDNIHILPKDLFTDYKNLFGLGMEDEMKLDNQKTDQLGMTRYKYYQYNQGYRIDGADVLVHERDGRTQSLNGNMVSGLNQPALAILSEETALTIALESMGQVTFLWNDEEAESLHRADKKDPAASWYPTGELVWSRNDGEAAFMPANFSLCWRFDVRITGESGESKRVFIDAATGEIIRKLSISYFCDAGTGNTAWYGNQDISTEKQVLSGNYELHDDCTGSHDYKIHTKDKNNGNGTTEYEDGNNTWTSIPDIDGVTTHWCAHRTLDYFSTVHGRNSYNDNGADVTAYNNGLGSFQSNACWGCDGNVMTFGEGPTTSSADDWNSMEVVGHEFAHGVTQETADLEYEKQSGALNESFSDIFGAVIENWTGAGIFDWTIGEEFGAPIRNMSNPNANNDPDTYKGLNWIGTLNCTPNNNNDACGVHTNSGVQNFFFFLLSIGGSGTNDNADAYNVSGIGINDAADIAYRALTVYLTSTSKYHDAREAWIRAANDLFGSCSDEALAVGNAWYAVGVGPDIGYYDNDVCGNIIAVLDDVKYNGINSVTAGIGCTTTVLPSTFSTTFEATNLILLDDGFTVESGATFYAIIDPCNISYWQRTESPETGDHFDEVEGEFSLSSLQIEVAPSPFTDYFDIRMVIPQGLSFQLELCDVSGKVLRTIARNQTSSNDFYQQKVDGGDLAAGMYLLSGFIGEERIQKQIVKVD
ncbi:MAG: M4 family metallopeptidase [Chitinophagales bacterium]|nr:M4 family metallopeptidase [Chitinophagales bacterium]